MSPEFMANLLIRSIKAIRRQTNRATLYITKAPVYLRTNGNLTTYFLQVTNWALDFDTYPTGFSLTPSYESRPYIAILRASEKYQIGIQLESNSTYRDAIEVRSEYLQPRAGARNVSQHLTVLMND